MAAAKSSAIRILAYLRKGRTLTTAKASYLFNISPDGVRARISELNKAGYPVYANDRNGRTTYRLGRATRREVVAGRVVLGDPYFRDLLTPVIDQHLSLVP